MFLFMVFIALHIQASHPYYYTLDNENGLPSNEVYQIKQDAFGFIWIGCDAGLFRYDGVSYKAYTNSSLKSASISGLTIDSRGNVWCQNFTGQIFRVCGDSLKTMVDATQRAFFNPQYTIDRFGNLWLVPDSTIEVYSYDAALIYTIKPNVFPLLKNDYFYDIQASKSGDIYLSTSLGYYYRIKPLTKQIESIYANPSPGGTRSSLTPIGDNIFSLTEMGTDRTYYVFEMGKETFHIHEVNRGTANNSIIYSLAKFSPSESWFTSSEGAIRVDENFVPVPKYPVLFPGEKISSVLKDREGNYWFSSLQNGIFIVPALDVFIYSPQNSALPEQHISFVKQAPKDHLFLGTYSGFAFTWNPDHAHEIKPFPQKPEPIYRTVKAIQEYKKQTYVSHGALSVIEANNEKAFASFNARDLYIYNDTLFFITHDRLGFLSAIDFKSNPINQGDLHILRKKGGKSISHDSLNNTLYFACHDGVFTFKNGETEELLYRGKSIYASKIEYHKGHIFIGTVNEGLLIKTAEGTYIGLNESAGLKGKSVKTVKVSDDFIFVVTEKCLNRIHIKNRTIDYLDREDGVLFKEVNAIEIFNEYLFLATIEGLIRLPLELKAQNHVAPHIQIEQIWVNGKRKNSNEKIQLPYSKNDLSIEFKSVGIRSRGKLRYHYRMDGIENEWKSTDIQAPIARYPSLPPGEYTFYVYATNEDGLAGNQIAHIRVEVAGPFWLSWWFLCLSGFVLIGAFYSFYIIRIRIIKREAETKNNLIRSQLTALKAQMNPHFMYNTLNSIQDLILMSDIPKTNYYLSRFSSLMRKVLDASDQHEITLQEEIEMLKLYLELENLRFGADFSYSVDVDEHMDTSEILLPGMVIQPFVENAIKHGLLHKKGAKTLQICFHSEGKTMQCSVIDNGVGRAKAAEIRERRPSMHKSFATSATLRRLELINDSREKKIELSIKDVYNESGEAGGTEVHIVFDL